MIVRNIFGAVLFRTIPKYKPGNVPKPGLLLSVVPIIVDYVTYYSGVLVCTFLFALTQNYQQKGVSLWYLVPLSLIVMIIVASLFQHNHDKESGYYENYNNMSSKEKRKPFDDVYAKSYTLGGLAYGFFFLIDTPPYHWFLNIPNTLANLIS